ncbi:MAG: DUF885 domain-containing protein [Bacteroidetes bacterium]|nr:DUF885 domain-containing protein [Bacteroidota bacterium]
MYSRLSFLPVVLLIVTVSCSQDGRSDPDRAFEELTARFLDRYLAGTPEEATALGDHRFDSLLTDFSTEAIIARAAFFRSYRDTLRSVRVETLSPQHMIDYDILRHALEAELYALEELREWEWNPLLYTVGNAVHMLIARDFAPIEERMRNLAGRLRRIPYLLKTARSNLSEPPAIHVQSAMLQNDGVITLLTQTLEPLLTSLPGDLRDSITTARTVAVEALYAYGSWLKHDLINRATGDFRLGADQYRRKFTLCLHTDMPPEELLAEAERELRVTMAEMAQVARVLFAEEFPGVSVPEDDEACIRRVLDRLSEQRPSDSTIVARAEDALRRTETFVRSRGLLTLSSTPLEIIVMPEFQRGVAVAYCDPAGPLERDGKTFFAIAPTPADWTAERRSSFYREYNDHMLLNLTVHEAVPGHATQLAAANRAQVPTLLRSVFPSITFAEGWATYCEELMATEGFGGKKLRFQQLKMKLRLLINAIIDQKIHTAGMREEEGMRLMTEQGFQENGEAAGKWRRACLTSAQLSSYFYGNRKIRELRARVERQKGDSFDLRTFHDQLLSYGTISPSYLPMLMKLPIPETPLALR